MAADQIVALAARTVTVGIHLSNRNMRCDLQILPGHRCMAPACRWPTTRAMTVGACQPCCAVEAMAAKRSIYVSLRTSSGEIQPAPYRRSTQHTNAAAKSRPGAQNSGRVGWSGRSCPASSGGRCGPPLSSLCVIPRRRPLMTDARDRAFGFLMLSILLLAIAIYRSLSLTATPPTTSPMEKATSQPDCRQTQARERCLRPHPRNPY
ncbi:hypothetical protein LMG23992_02229 [Cupriavidus laharis]|uniref:Uncharacterized protein n=1 Tax=Cupriavidus laharis TaxID=151654 RepID=A0ABM8WY02_9BURK|nr:hypothetical protein LMG23992_02229 [Cupriavidus laharis]